MKNGDSFFDEIFGKGTRRLLLSAFVSALITPAIAQSSQQPSAGNKEEISAEYLKQFSTEQKQEMDNILLQHAYKNLSAIVASSGNKYSETLRMLQDQTNAYIARQGATDRYVVIFDPLQFDMVEALDLDEDSIAKMIVQNQIGQDAPGTLSLSVSGLDKTFKLPTEDIITTDQAHAYLHESDSGKVLLTIVPISPHAMPYNIDGLTVEENVTFANKHEAWHCIDLAMGLTSFIYYNQRGAISGGDRLEKYRSNEFKEFTLSLNRESFADVAALGDMIREGKDISIISPAIAWRHSYNENSIDEQNDLTHFTVAALKDLQRRIEKMGVKKFRAMDENEVRDFYLDIVSDNSMSPLMLHKADKYFGVSPDSLATDTAHKNNVGQKFLRLYAHVRQGMYKAEALVNRETRKMLNFSALMEKRTGRKGITLTSDEKDSVAEKLEDWKPQEIIYDRAIKDYGKITPETMLRTYSRVCQELLEDLQRDKSSVPYIVTLTKLEKLRDEITISLNDDYYINANAEYGVNLLKVEPLLAKFKPADTELNKIKVRTPEMTNSTVKNAKELK